MPDPFHDQSRRDYMLRICIVLLWWLLCGWCVWIFITVVAAVAFTSASFIQLLVYPLIGILVGGVIYWIICLCEDAR